jgi:ubiquinone/menaquinone biosynthesis C-methylase UbiE
MEFRMTMQRIIEPELMDDAEQAEAYDKADFSAAHGRRVQLFIERFQRPDLTGTVLDLGCGSGDILQRFATSLPLANFVGIDGSQPMLDLSRARLEKAGLIGRVKLVQAFIPSNDIPSQEYAVIMSHSLLHHLHQPEVLWQTVKQLAGKNTYVFVADLRRPASAQAANDVVEKLSGGEPEVLKRDFYNSLCAAFTKNEIEEQLKAAGLALKVEEAGDIHILVHGRTGTLN